MSEQATVHFEQNLDITLEENETTDRRACIWSAIHKSKLALDVDDGAKNCFVLNLSENFVISTNMKLTAYELQYALRSMGTLIPTDEIVSLFIRGRDTELNDGGSHQDLDGCFYSMSIERIRKQLNTDTTFKRGFTYQVYKNLSSNITAVINSLYIVAGMIYVIAGQMYYRDIQLETCYNLYLVASIIYLLNSGKFLIDFPLNELRARVQSEIKILEFKQAILLNAASYGTVNRTKSDSKNLHLLQYIENNIFQGDPHKVLTMRDLEMLLLRELGVMYSGRVLSDILSAMDEDHASVKSLVSAPSSKIILFFLIFLLFPFFLTVVDRIGSRISLFCCIK